MNRHLAQIARFLLVGLANTAVGLAAIFVALAAGLGDVPANALGYLVGFAVSFVLNGRWTFGRAAVDAARMWRFLLVTVAAYGANLGTMIFARDAMGIDHRWAQLLGMVVYTTVGFLGARNFAFRSHPRASR